MLAKKEEEENALNVSKKKQNKSKNQKNSQKTKQKTTLIESLLIDRRRAQHTHAYWSKRKIIIIISLFLFQNKNRT